MKVLVTGGTGFVGSHSVAALQSAGHDLRLLARTPGKVEQVLGPLGVSLDEIEVVPGDATDEAAVDAAVRGCAAVLNCVSMVSLSRHDEDAVRSVNIRSAEVVLGAATRAGLDPVVHVSSVSALLPPAGGAVLTADAEVGEPPGGYMRSKAEADRAARRRQADGLPVVLTYPTMVVGPHDPTMGEGMGMLARVLRGHVPALPPGGMEMIDVRDLAKVHAAAMVAGRGPRRFIVNGTHLPATEVVARLRRLTGRRLPCGRVPTGLVAGFLRLGELAQRVVSVPMPLTSEGLWVLTLDARSDDTSTRRDLGVQPRPLDETLADTVRWMARNGVISDKQAGLLGI